MSYVLGQKPFSSGRNFITKWENLLDFLSAAYMEVGVVKMKTLLYCPATNSPGFKFVLSRDDPFFALYTALFCCFQGVLRRRKHQTFSFTLRF